MCMATDFISPQASPLLFDEDRGHNQAKVLQSQTMRPDAAVVTFDDLLVAVGKSRSRDAFVRLFEHYAPRVKSFLMKGGLSPAQADEVAQETLLTVWQKAPAYDPQKAGAGTWIFTIARNKRIDLQRKSGRETPLPDHMELPASAQDAPDIAAGAAQDSKALAAAIAALPPEQANMIRKTYFEDKTHNDIAAETGIPLGTVKSRIRLALGKLRETMKGVGA